MEMATPISETGVLLKDLLIGMTMFGAGTALYLAAMNIWTSYKYHTPTLRYAVARISWVGIVLLVASAVAKVTSLAPEWRIFAYLFFLTSGGVSFIFITVGQKHELDSWKHHGH